MSAWHEATVAVSPSITSVCNDLIDVIGYSIHKHLLEFLTMLETTQCKREYRDSFKSSNSVDTIELL